MNLPHLNRPVVKKPWRARRQAGKDQKNPIFPTQMRDLSLRANHERNKPRHEKNDRRSNSGRQIRIDAVDPYLCKNWSQRREKRGQDRIDDRHRLTIISDALLYHEALERKVVYYRVLKFVPQVRASSNGTTNISGNETSVPTNE